MSFLRLGWRGSFGKKLMKNPFVWPLFFRTITQFLLKITHFWLFDIVSRVTYCFYIIKDTRKLFWSKLNNIYWQIYRAKLCSNLLLICDSENNPFVYNKYCLFLMYIIQPFILLIFVPFVQILTFWLTNIISNVEIHHVIKY